MDSVAPPWTGPAGHSAASLPMAALPTMSMPAYLSAYYHAAFWPLLKKPLYKGRLHLLLHCTSPLCLSAPPSPLSSSFLPASPMPSTLPPFPHLHPAACHSCHHGGAGGRRGGASPPPGLPAAWHACRRHTSSMALLPHARLLLPSNCRRATEAYTSHATSLL